MEEKQRQQAIAEIDRALADLRAEMAEAIRHGDRELYVALANRYGRLHQRWEQLQRPQVGPVAHHPRARYSRFPTVKEGGGDGEA